MKKSLKLLGNLLFVVILIAILFSYAMFQGGFVSWFLFSGFLPILLYQLGFLLYPINNWKVSRQLSHQVIRAGDGVSVMIRIQRRFPFPIYYCTLEETFSESLNKMDSGHAKYHLMDQPNKLILPRKIKKAVFPGFKRTILIDYSLSQIPRGEHQLKAIRVRTGDIFGFVKKEQIFTVKNKLVATPNQLPVRITETISNFEQGTVSSISNTITNTNVAAGVREYEPGDRFSWIDWKQTARKNTVMTKEFEQEKSTNILLILDNCYYASLNPLAYEASVEITLSLVEAIRKKNTEVSLLSVGGDKQKISYFPMHQDRVSKNLIADHLTRVHPTGNLPFVRQLKEQIMRIGNGDIVFLITTNMDEEFKQTVQQINRRMKYVQVIYIQSSSYITEIQQQIIGQLQIEGIGMQVITEVNLVNKPIEVTLK
ncbi:DUF58 domain-containing protein [Oceanobacillus halophilus]|uniref:DUF58 domain-containing protein n=1 Tax=Oceanobacillus halophilus TaxID=930130 RepID=A0A495A4G8_9BACI|nr:DUF58 domain-containing protein [Oceanobacillus halophilus]RKQ34589.1 DUF58 domain-containing protein [Oceanobacillus halophilus]